MGIARGVAYLHQDLGMRIIHRNLTPRNILLDINMNPKISGFDRAKTLEEGHTESVASSIYGSIGYICPEYHTSFRFSIKTDVFSFGVVVLQIVSGRKCIYLHNEHPIDRNICDETRKLWEEDKALNMVDESIRGDELNLVEEEEEVLRCIHVGLLCAIRRPDRRPMMPRVIKLLEGEESVNLQEMEMLLRQEQDPSCNSDEDPTPNDSLDATFEYDITLER